jgi:hypothetical protein
MQTFPDPVVERVGSLYVVRDDLIPGGTKRRVIGRFITGYPEVVYASPAYGYAQVALAYACADAGIQATIFTAARKQYHLRTIEAQRAGAHIIGVPYGYLTNVQAKANAHTESTGALMLPFGFDFPEFGDALATEMRRADVKPSEIWCVAGSGTLARALQQAFPSVPAHAVQVGRDPDVGAASLYTAPEPFERDAKAPPPFPSTSNFDAKSWQFITRHAAPDALFWNVAG